MASVNIKKRVSVRNAPNKPKTSVKGTASKPLRELTAAYFSKKAAKATGAEKFLVMLEMNKYISQSVQSGVTFKELKKQGFKFATV